jgi:3-deoxy-D-manno-octulosonic-acid transferase
MFLIYSLIYILLLPLLILRDLLTLDKNKLKTIQQKLGLNISIVENQTIWLHGVSLGEIKILSPLAQKLSDQGQNILITSTTNTGLEELSKNFSNSAIKILPFPYDLGFAHKKIISNYKVSKIILFESEFWPNLLNVAKNLNVVSLNTTISDTSYRRFKMLKAFSRHLFRKIDLFLAQSRLTIDRLEFFGVKKIKLIGNIKINPENYSVDLNKKDHYQKILGSEKLNVILGSSHEGEEIFVVEALAKMNINLILAPRHPERVSKVVKELENFGLKGIKMSSLQGEVNTKINDNEILVFDEVGDLINLYAAGDLAIVAGSINYTKGHNFMEPVFVNTLSITGSKLDNYRQIKEDICDTNIIETFSEQDELRSLISKYQNITIRNEKSSAQNDALKSYSGSYDEIIKFIDEL